MKNNVIDYALNYKNSLQTASFLATIRELFSKRGIILPPGDIKNVCEAIKKDKYMWRQSNSMYEAQDFVDKGYVAIGINANEIVVLSKSDNNDPVAQTAWSITNRKNAMSRSLEELMYFVYGFQTGSPK